MLSLSAFLEKAIGYPACAAGCVLLVVAYRKITGQPMDRDDLISACKLFGLASLNYLLGLTLWTVFKWIF